MANIPIEQRPKLEPHKQKIRTLQQNVTNSRDLEQAKKAIMEYIEEIIETLDSEKP